MRTDIKKIRRGRQVGAQRSAGGVEAGFNWRASSTVISIGPEDALLCLGLVNGDHLTGALSTPLYAKATVGSYPRMRGRELTGRRSPLVELP